MASWQRPIPGTCRAWNGEPRLRRLQKTLRSRQLLPGRLTSLPRPKNSKSWEDSDENRRRKSSDGNKSVLTERKKILAEIYATGHETSHPALQHHFENMEQQREAGTLGMWVFLVTEIMFFGSLFLAYTLYRYQYPEAFAAASNHLDIRLGAINTIVLIFSSFTMAMAVYSTQMGKRRNSIICLLLTIVLGLTFLGIKAVEYHDKYRDSLIPGQLIPGRPFNPEVAKPGDPDPHKLHVPLGVP